jgi:DNA polymerase phi
LRGADHYAEAGLQREATHFKIRGLDLLDIFVKRCPQHSQVPRLVLPLIQIILGASADEQQLVEKTNGLLRKRIGLLQQFPEDVDAAPLEEDLQELHSIARKLTSRQLSQESLLSSVIYLSKVLVHVKRSEAVITGYKGSLEDFIKRKGSKLWPNFFSEFIKRLPSAAWAMRLEFIKSCLNEEAINSFRQTQAVQWLSTLLPLAVQQVGTLNSCYAVC